MTRRNFEKAIKLAIKSIERDISRVNDSHLQKEFLKDFRSERGRKNVREMAKRHFQRYNTMHGFFGFQSSKPPKPTKDLEWKVVKPLGVGSN